MENLFKKLRQRQIFKVATIYIVAAWPLIQIVDIAIPALGLPDSVLQLLFKVFLVGFPISLIFAWLTNFTPEGVVRAGKGQKASAEESKSSVNLRAFATVGGALVVASLITLGSQILWGDESAPDTTALNAVPTPPLVDDGRESIAVLPFEVFSDDVNDEHFVDGMVEELLNLLAKVPELSVAARTSSFAYKGVRDKTIMQIGQELGVDRILEGSLRKNDVENRIRVTAQLIEVSTGAHLFSETFDREYRDIFQIQDEIARLVTEKMKRTLLPNAKPISFVAGTKNVDAMVEFGKGQKELAHRTSSSITKALEHFKTAAQLDSNYARAQVGISDATILLALYGSLERDTAFKRAQEALDTAFELDPESGAAYASQGLLYSELHQKDEAEAAFKRAIELNPSYAMAYMWYGSVLRARGDDEGANAHYAKASELDPKSPVAAFNVAWGHYMLGDEAAAMEWFSKIVANDPYYPGAYTMVGNIIRASGRLDESLDMFERALNVDPQNKSAISSLLVASMDLGDEDEVQRWFKYVEDNPGILTNNEQLQLEARYFISTEQDQKAIDTLQALSFSPSEQFIQYLIDGEIAYYTDDHAAAIESFEKLRATRFAEGVFFYQMSEGQPAIHLAQSYLKTGRDDEAAELLRGLQEFFEKEQVKNPANSANYYVLALIHTMKQDKESAINHFQAAIDSGWVQTWQAKIEPIFEDIREEPRFQQMLGGVNARLAYMRSRLNNEDEEALAGSTEI